MKSGLSSYRIQLTVSVYKEKKLLYKNEILVPSLYTLRSEAREHIRREIRHRMSSDNYFRSPRADYDLVRYEEEATRNTFIRYRITEESAGQQSEQMPYAESVRAQLNRFFEDA
jgi:hypothetical protein